MTWIASFYLNYHTFPAGLVFFFSEEIPNDSFVAVILDKVHLPLAWFPKLKLLL
jgi:hypothetical protein